MSGKFVISRSSDGQFRFNLKASNGEIILTSELYKAKASALNGIESVKKNAAHDERYEKKMDKGGHARFNLKAANGEIIGSSQGYSSEATRDHGIESVKANARDAAVDDETEAPGQK